MDRRYVCRRDKPIIYRGGVYFVQSGDFVKIGISVNIHSRLEEIRRLNPHQVDVVGYIPLPGELARDKERRLHDRFARWRHSGEWFHASDELLTYIRTHAQSWQSTH